MRVFHSVFFLLCSHFPIAFCVDIFGLPLSIKDPGGGLSLRLIVPPVPPYVMLEAVQLAVTLIFGEPDSPSRVELDAALKITFKKPDNASLVDQGSHYLFVSTVTQLTLNTLIGAFGIPGLALPGCLGNMGFGPGTFFGFAYNPIVCVRCFSFLLFFSEFFFFFLFRASESSFSSCA